MTVTTDRYQTQRRRLILGVPAPEVPWLLYLGFLVLQPLLDPTSRWGAWLYLMLLVAAFIPVYGWTHRVIGARPWLWRQGVPGATLGIAGMVALTIVGSVVNSGAATFSIYALAAAGKLTPRRYALTVMGVALAGVCAAFLVSSVPVRFRLLSFVPAVVIGPIIGLSVLFDRERRATNAKLRMAQQEVEQLAAIAERERIARDLHDLLGHTLSTITLKSELAASLVSRDPQRAETEIRDVERLSRDTLAEVRSVVRGYRVTGFSGELANAKLALEAANISFDYFVGSLQLQPAAEGVLALALREAVTNVVRHAGATTCRATLDADQAFVTLTVEDNGRGAVAAQEPAGSEPGGFGLGAMRERARALGGFVTVQPSAGANRAGTRVSVSLPVVAALQTAESDAQAMTPAERPAHT